MIHERYATADEVGRPAWRPVKVVHPEHYRPCWTARRLAVKYTLPRSRSRLDRAVVVGPTGPVKNSSVRWHVIIKPDGRPRLAGFGPTELSVVKQFIRRHRGIRGTVLLGITVFALTCSGCIDLTGLPSDPVAQTVKPGNAHLYKYPGHLYAMRGFLGIFSTGMDLLVNKLNRRHIVASAAVADEARYAERKFLIRESIAGRLTGPLILVGHSWGADDQVRIARALGRAGIKVNLLLLIDPVTPPPVPANVIRCVDIYKSHPLTDWIPVWRGVPDDAHNPAVTDLTVINLRTAKVGFDTSVVNHVNISAVPGVQKMMMHYILDTLHRAAGRPVTVGVATLPGSVHPPSTQPSTGAAGGAVIQLMAKSASDVTIKQ